MKRKENTKTVQYNRRLIILLLLTQTTRSHAVISTHFHKCICNTKMYFKYIKYMQIVGLFQYTKYKLLLLSEHNTKYIKCISITYFNYRTCISITAQHCT